MNAFRRQSRLVATALLVIASVLPVHAADPAAAVKPILTCMKANIPPHLQVRDFELIATDKVGGTRTLAGRLNARLEDGRINAMMGITAPADMRGAAYLVRESETPDKEEEMYVYLPALKKVRRITGGMKDTALFGTDLSYSDVKQIYYALSGNTLRLERTEALEGRPAWVLSMAGEVSAGAGFDRMLGWVDQKSCMLLKADFQQGGVVRRRFLSAAKYLAQSGPYWYVSEGRIDDLQEKTHTVLRITGVSGEKELTDRLFNPRMFFIGN